MVVVMNPDAPAEAVEEVYKRLMKMEVEVTLIEGAQQCVFALVGDTSKLEMATVVANPHVERVMRVQQPYKLASRTFHPADTVVEIGECKIGGGHKVVIAGPSLSKVNSK
jgi:3-deoxy-7-phosphoheptulonate synthase